MAILPYPEDWVVVELENAKVSKYMLEIDIKKIKTDSGNSKTGEKVGSAWTPSKTMIAVVGTVRDEKVMMTSRGGSIGGTVIVENEEGEELAEVVPDEDGHFTIDFGDLAMGAIATAITITQLDLGGNPQTSTTVDYIPGDPLEVSAPPEITSTDGPYFENGQPQQWEGLSFGDNTVVEIIPGLDTGEPGLDTGEPGEPGETGTLLETLSTSSTMVQAFLDAPVGPAEVIVWNEYGSSEPIEIGVYEFDVRAGKTNLTKNEKTSVIANYEGLPEGTKIIFTNMSKNVTVKPKGKGEVNGKDITFIVGESTGEVSMTLKARQAGGWIINYRLEFPYSD